LELLFQLLKLNSIQFTAEYQNSIQFKLLFQLLKLNSIQFTAEYQKFGVAYFCASLLCDWCACPVQMVWRLPSTSVL